MAADSFSARSTLTVGGQEYGIHRLDALQSSFDVARLPYTLRILLENVLRTGSDADVEAVATWVARDEPSREISFSPARVLLQDFTGVPAVVDLAAMRDAMADLGGEAAQINPLIPVELVIDHSVQVDEFGTRAAFRQNVDREFERNFERYAFLRWGQEAFRDFKVVPPGTGIVHQVNLEYLARVIETRDGEAFPDTLVGTDSHTTMVNGLGVLGWGVGGIEAEAAMLGEAVSMLVPQVVGFRLSGELPEGATATDLVLTVTQILRETGVVGKFVEYFGHGLVGLPLADRATLGNMSPEYGATCGFFPVDEETLKYLRLTGRDEQRVALVEAYCKENLLWHDPSEAATYSQVVELDLTTVEPSLAGPRRPQDRVPLRTAKESFAEALGTFGVTYPDGSLDKAVANSFPASDPPAETTPGAQPSTTEEEAPVRVALDTASAAITVKAEDGSSFELDHGAVVIAAITSCTNTSNPAVMVAAGLLAKKAVERGLGRKPWVKTSLAPGSKVVTDYYDRAGLTPLPRGARLPHRRLRLHDLHRELRAVARVDLPSRRRGQPRRVRRALGKPQLRGADPSRGEGELPRLAAARRRVRTRGDDGSRPDDRAARLGPRRRGRLPARHLAVGARDLRHDRGRDRRRPLQERLRGRLRRAATAWKELPVPEGDLFAWADDSTYVRLPPYFDGMSKEPGTVEDIAGARCLVRIGDSVTTDHISPAGAIKPESPAGRYLVEHGVERKDFNSYGSRRGNHEVMVRGTFANVRLRNLLVPGSEGTWTVHLPSGEETTIFEASERYLAEGVPLIVIAGKEYGSGSSRDWAAKGPNLLGVRAVIAESYERIHRSNLLMMGILPLQFRTGETMESLGLTGRETFSIEGIQNGEARQVRVRADGTTFSARVRLDTPREREYLRHGGILPYVLRRLLAS